MIFPLPVTKDT